MTALRDSGIDARLTVIGCTPPEAHRSEHVTVHPQLNKAVPEELHRFEAAIAAAHFLVQPSYESYGFAFCEASAMGLPALCLRVGGVPVRDGVNGHALPPGATPGDFAALIRRYLDDAPAYAALCASARREYEVRLNWDAWGWAPRPCCAGPSRRNRGARWRDRGRVLPLRGRSRQEHTDVPLSADRPQGAGAAIRRRRLDRHQPVRPRPGGADAHGFGRGRRAAVHPP
ncbi:glycosyltransferase [Ponticoccus litoralis]|uniref:Glycosyltransferase n=1 Tax=Ponticoccus litoralis TaxID=422297 RepID=A0AAW9S970_9RHOB